MSLTGESRRIMREFENPLVDRSASIYIVEAESKQNRRFVIRLNLLRKVRGRVGCLFRRVRTDVFVFIALFGAVFAACGDGPNNGSGSSAPTAMAEGTSESSTDLIGAWVGFCRDFDVGGRLEFLGNNRVIVNGTGAGVNFLAEDVLELAAGGTSAVFRYSLSKETLLLSSTASRTSGGSCPFRSADGDVPLDVALIGKWETRPGLDNACYPEDGDPGIPNEITFYSDGFAEGVSNHSDGISRDFSLTEFSLAPNQLTLGSKSYGLEFSGNGGTPTLAITQSGTSCFLYFQEF